MDESEGRRDSDDTGSEFRVLSDAPVMEWELVKSTFFNDRSVFIEGGTETISLHELEEKPRNRIVRVVSCEEDDECIIAAEDQDITSSG